MPTNSEMPASVSAHTQLRNASGLRVGLARDVRKIEPPSRWMRLTSAMVSGLLTNLPSVRCLNPS